MDKDAPAASDDNGAGGDSSLLRIELGGGHCPREGFINCDLHQGDVQCDLNDPLPFESDSVQQVYSSHCLEHVTNVAQLLQEIARVCVVGAKVTIKVPHYGQEMAMCPGHQHVISEQMVEHFREFQGQWWPGEKKLVLRKKAYSPTKYFEEASQLFPKLSPEQIYRFVQNTCHEVIFVFAVEKK